MFLELTESYLNGGGVPDEVAVENFDRITIAQSQKDLSTERIAEYMEVGKHYVVEKSFLKAKCIYLYCINNSTDSNVKVRSMSNLSHVLTELKDLKNAEVYASKALKIDPQYVKAFVRLSVINEMQSNFDAVRAVCNDALTVDPECQYFKNKLRKCDAVDSKAKSNEKAMKGL